MRSDLCSLERIDLARLTVTTTTNPGKLPGLFPHPAKDRHANVITLSCLRASTLHSQGSILRWKIYDNALYSRCIFNLSPSNHTLWGKQFFSVWSNWSWVDLSSKATKFALYKFLQSIYQCYLYTGQSFPSFTSLNAFSFKSHKVLGAQQSLSTHTLSAYQGPPVTGRRAAPGGVPGLLRSVHADPPVRANSCRALKDHIAWQQPAFLTFLPKPNMAASVHTWMLGTWNMTDTNEWML